MMCPSLHAQVSSNVLVCIRSSTEYAQVELSMQQLYQVCLDVHEYGTFLSSAPEYGGVCSKISSVLDSSVQRS
jgi:hypothetical protein